MKSQKICAIICEYNPLHKGHQYLIEKARELSCCDFVMCIMSGNFTQRGDIAILDKHKRAKIALSAGADIVVQIPTAYASCSAEVFALAGVKIANSFNNVTHLCFGSSLDEVEPLKQIANYLITEPKEYKKLLKANLDNGLSYNSSRTNALVELAKTDKNLPENVQELLANSNNILAIEYLKALKSTNSKITPITTKRIGESFNSKKITEYCSASAIRQELYTTKTVKNVAKALPDNIFDEFRQELVNQALPDIALYNQLRLFKVRTTDINEIENVFDVSEGLHNRLYHLARQSADYEEFVKQVATKRYSDSKINRIITGLMLGIDKKIVEQIYKLNTLPYIKVLAVRKNRVLNNLQSNTCVILRTNDVKKTNNYVYNKLTQIEDNADSIYTQLTNTKVVNVPYLSQPPIINSKLS